MIARIFKRNLSYILRTDFCKDIYKLCQNIATKNDNSKKKKEIQIVGILTDLHGIFIKIVEVVRLYKIVSYI